MPGEATHSMKAARCIHGGYFGPARMQMWRPVGNTRTENQSISAVHQKHLKDFSRRRPEVLAENSSQNFHFCRSIEFQADSARSDMQRHTRLSSFGRFDLLRSISPFDLILRLVASLNRSPGSPRSPLFVWCLAFRRVGTTVAALP